MAGPAHSKAQTPYWSSHHDLTFQAAPCFLLGRHFQRVVQLPKLYPVILCNSHALQSCAPWLRSEPERGAFGPDFPGCAPSLVSHWGPLRPSLFLSRPWFSRLYYQKVGCEVSLCLLRILPSLCPQIWAVIRPGHG